MRTLYLFGTILLIFLVACCGCTSETNGTPAPGTPTTTPISTTSPPAGITPLPSATQTMPPGKEVIFDVRRDQIQPTITVTFRGGAGQAQIREILVTMYSGDGRVETQRLESRVGSEVVFQGTREIDRIVISVELMTAERFTVMNREYDFRERR